MVNHSFFLSFLCDFWNECVLMKEKNCIRYYNFTRSFFYSFKCLHITMLYICRRRHSRNRFVTFLTIFGAFLIISLIIRSGPIITETTNRKDASPRLFCILIHTHSTHERFIHLSNITWAKHCHKIGIARFRRVQSPDDGKLTESSGTFYKISMRMVNEKKL
jgi:hypothetical protein